MYAEINTIYNWGNFDTYAEINKWNVTLLNTVAQLLLLLSKKYCEMLYDKKPVKVYILCDDAEDWTGANWTRIVWLTFFVFLKT